MKENIHNRKVNNNTDLIQYHHSVSTDSWDKHFYNSMVVTKKQDNNKNLIWSYFFTHPCDFTWN